MADTFSASMSKTTKAFNEIVLPIFNKKYPEYKFVSIEGRANDEITKDFDIYAGIDVYRVQSERGEMIGIASRIQFDKNWATFTVRKSRESGNLTEYGKRKYAIAHGSMYPYLTMQAYISESETVIGLCRTKDLIDYIDTHNPQTRTTGRDQYGQATFFVCPWADMKEKGYTVVILRCADEVLKAA